MISALSPDQAYFLCGALLRDPRGKFCFKGTGRGWGEALPLSGLPLPSSFQALTALGHPSNFLCPTPAPSEVKGPSARKQSPSSLQWV